MKTCVFSLLGSSDIWGIQTNVFIDSTEYYVFWVFFVLTIAEKFFVNIFKAVPPFIYSTYSCVFETRAIPDIYYN